MSNYSLENFLDNKHYLKYKKQKQKIVDKHPNITFYRNTTGPSSKYIWTEDERKELESGSSCDMQPSLTIRYDIGCFIVISK